MRDFEGNIVTHPYIALYCGSTAEFDEGSGCSYRCTTCGATIGSIAEPTACVNARKEVEGKALAWKMLKRK